MASDLCKYCQAGFAGTTLSVTVRACGLLAALPHGQRPRNALTSTDLKAGPVARLRARAIRATWQHG